MKPTPNFNVRSVHDSSPENLPIPLPVEFAGRGEVKGFAFRQLQLSNAGCIYEVSDTFGNKWYEVFKIVIDRRFNRIAYPKSNAFGKTAWTAKTLGKALERFAQITTSELASDQ